MYLKTVSKVNQYCMVLSVLQYTINLILITTHLFTLLKFFSKKKKQIYGIEFIWLFFTICMFNKSFII